MANISIFKITVQYGRNEHTKKDFYAVKCREIPGEFEEYLAETGDIYRKADVDFGYHIVAVSRTRGVSDESRSIFARMLKIYKEQQQAKKDKEEAEKKIWETKSEMSGQSALLLDSLGLLSNDAFCAAFKASLPDSLRRQIDKGYSVRIDANNDLCVVRHIYIEKYFRSASFIQEEYDGTVYIVDGGEKYPEYKRYISEYSVPLSTKAKFKEWLSIGDKDCLTYTGVYVLPLKDKKTQGYAEKLAKEFAK